MTNLAVLGQGFLGSAVVSQAHRSAVPVRALHALRCEPQYGQDTGAGPGAYDAPSASEAFDALVGALGGCDAVINCAGLALAGSNDQQRLRAANVTWPTRLGGACAAAGVRRLVHVSTAAVQGRRDPLDETLDHQPFSPYSASKAEAEVILVDQWRSGRSAEQLVLYRPTSVLGQTRAVARSLARFARWAPLNGDGRQPLPVALVENVAAAALHLAIVEQPPLVALHPWEGMTTRQLLDVFEPGRRRLRLPSTAWRAALRTCRWASRSPRLGASCRQLELLYSGQSINATALAERGFVPPVGEEGWHDLASAVAAGKCR